MLSEDFEEKVNLLNSTLRDSIEKLLEKASKENAILPPFGRPPTPTPFVEDDEEVCQDGTEDDDTRNDAADFKYEYGFNPLTFLAEFIHRAHPDSIALRNQQKADARARLRHRAGHARNHLETAAGLSQRALQLRSGIIHGPLTSPCSPTSVIFFCRPVAVGEVVVQLSLDRNFVEATTTRLSSNGPSDPLKAVLNDLQPASKYFCRCHLELPGEVDQTGVEVSYASCQFWTLLDIPSSNTDNEVPHQEVEVVAINGHYRQLRKDCGTSCMSISDDESVRPMFSVVLGDIFDATSSQSTDAQLWQLFRQDPIFAAFCNEKDRNSMLTMSSMLCAWNDSQKGSDTGLKAEEIVHKQWSYDTRKYEKRQKEKLEKEKKEAFEQKAGGPSPSRKRSVAPPPALNRPAMSLAFSKLAKEFPLQYSEDNVRHLYRSFPLSQDAEAFVLDSRNGYLGKDQVRWLKDSIRKSSAAIKIIFSGKTFGYHLVDHLTSAVQDQVTDDTEIDAAGDNINSDLQDGVVEGKEELTVTLSDRQENATDSTTPLGDSTVVSPSSAAQQGKQNNVKKVSSSRQRALEATKEEFDDDGLSKSSLAHVVVSTHRKLYPLTEKHEDYSNEEGEDIDLEEEDTGTRLDSKLVLSGGILIVSSADTEESFAATYNFGRTSDEVQAEDFFCLEVGLGRAGNGGEPQVCEEKPALTAEEVLVSKGRKVLYRSSSDLDVMDDNVNSMSCSIVVKENGVLNVAMKRVDSGVIAFEKCVSSALFAME